MPIKKTALRVKRSVFFVFRKPLPLYQGEIKRGLDKHKTDCHSELVCPWQAQSHQKAQPALTFANR